MVGGFRGPTENRIRGGGAFADGIMDPTEGKREDYRRGLGDNLVLDSNSPHIRDAVSKQEGTAICEGSYRRPRLLPPPASKRPGRRNRLPRPVLGNDEYTHARRRAPGRGYVRARPSPRGGPSPFRWSRAPSTSAQCVASWRRPIVRMPGPDWQSRWSRILAFLPKRRRTRMRLHCCTFLQREKYLDLL